MTLRRQLLRAIKLRNFIVWASVIVSIYLLIKIITDTSKSLDLKLENSFNQELQAKNILPENSIFIPTSLKKIDWHDYKQIETENRRIGFGENGKPASLSKDDAVMEKELYAKNGFNGLLSDKISVNRSVKDIRHPGCKTKLYIESLPTVSIVVPFHNEHWSTLLRTVHSALNRSPKGLIKEIYLVDDASTKHFLKDKLDDYFAKNVPIVKILRLPARRGLITARLTGAGASTADVLIFLDSHTEANVNWLPPLLEPIALNYKTVVCPFIDVIAFDTLEYRAQDEGARGAFDWEFFYKRLPILPKDNKNIPEPFESPIMAGGLFAISRVFFWELGGYDPGLDIWGGEQYELSFKIWQCGGRMLDAPCSRVGHMYRKFAPFPNPGHGDFVAKNYRRVADVWMDEYAQYLYNRRPHYLKSDPGDISEQKALREKLKCKSFRWFLHQVAFDLLDRYPPIDPEPFAEGRVHPATHPQLCLDMENGSDMNELKLKDCEHKGEQYFIFTWHKDIRSNKRGMCWDLPESKPGSPIKLYSCHSGGGNQMWRYYSKEKNIRDGSGRMCVDWDVTNLNVYIQACDVSKETQKWDVDEVNEHMMEKWQKDRPAVTGPSEDY